MFGSSTCQTSHLCQYLINTSTYIWCHHVIVLSVDTCHLMYPMMGIQICAVTFSSCFKPDFISYCTERMQSRIPFSVIWFTIFFISQNVLSQLSLIIRNTISYASSLHLQHSCLSRVHFHPLVFFTTAGFFAEREQLGCGPICVIRERVSSRWAPDLSITRIASCG